jgi:hypothetical protein
VGDPTIVHALSGLIPEHVESQSLPPEKWLLLRRILSDDHYFNKKTYVTCYCEPDFRPTIPSMQKYYKLTEARVETVYRSEEDKRKETSESVLTENSALAYIGMGVQSVPTTGPRTLKTFRKLANMVLSVTTGRKMKENVRERQSYVITGFGYALMDIFDNEFFDMSYVIKEDKEKVIK